MFCFSGKVPIHGSPALTEIGHGQVFFATAILSNSLLIGVQVHYAARSVGTPLPPAFFIVEQMPGVVNPPLSSFFPCWIHLLIYWFMHFFMCFPLLSFSCFFRLCFKLFSLLCIHLFTLSPIAGNSSSSFQLTTCCWAKSVPSQIRCCRLVSQSSVSNFGCWWSMHLSAAIYLFIFSLLICFSGIQISSSI